MALAYPITHPIGRIVLRPLPMFRLHCFGGTRSSSGIVIVCSICTPSAGNQSSSEGSRRTFEAEVLERVDRHDAVDLAAEVLPRLQPTSIERLLVELANQRSSMCCFWFSVEDVHREIISSCDTRGGRCSAVAASISSVIVLRAGPDQCRRGRVAHCGHLRRISSGLGLGRPAHGPQVGLGGFAASGGEVLEHGDEVGASSRW